MPFARATLSTLIDSTLADIAARLTGANPFLRRAVLNVMGRVVAAQHNDELGYLDWQSRMAVPVTARGEYIDAWAAIRGVYRKAAAYAVGTATVTGGTPGVSIPALTGLIRPDGFAYQVGSGVTLDGSGNATLTVTASTSGEAGNAPAGTLLQFGSPIIGVPTNATVVTMTGGADVETDDLFLTRMLKTWAMPPQGGDLNDYQQWTLEVPGVTRAWAGGFDVMTTGTVTAFFMMDDGVHPNGLPIGSNGVSRYESRDIVATGDQLAVADHLYPLRPVTALVYAAAPVGVPLDLILAEVPNVTAIRDGVTAALNGVLLREASPSGVTLPDLSPGGTVRLSHITDSLAAVAGLDHFILVSPTADVTVPIGSISVPGSVSYL